MEYLKNINQIKYEGSNSKNPFAFHYYNANEKILGKTMKEHLKFAMS
jgi:xylose isomerase